ncbi:MAG: hypothetical protein AB1861_04445 [Cyanobacteriota bacterium]
MLGEPTQVGAIDESSLRVDWTGTGKAEVATHLSKTKAVPIRIHFHQATQM